MPRLTFLQQVYGKDDRVRDCSHATQGAVRSGTQHRSESVVAQSPTPTAPTVKNRRLFLTVGAVGVTPK